MGNYGMPWIFITEGDFQEQLGVRERERVNILLIPPSLIVNPVL